MNSDILCFIIIRCIPDYNVATAVEFINKLKNDELAKDGKRNRGPFLALLELLRQLINDNNMKDLLKGNWIIRYNVIGKVVENNVSTLFSNLNGILHLWF